MWDPGTYLAFADHRSRPFFDLLNRVPADAPRRVADLGCGPGNLTATLARRWPSAVVEALDSSAEMVQAARERGLAAEVGDVGEWTPRQDTDVVVSNAVLQWVPGHESLLARWVGQLPAGAWLAFQVPGNFGAPSHREIRALAAAGRWNLESVVLREDDAVLDPAGYADLLADLGCEVDAWETTYLHRLTGADAVLEWVTGTALRPIRANLDDDEWGDFRTELAARLRAAYPPRPDGTTWFPYRRVFAVARVP
ncbi:trans-aconitate 2-methyltransferase [Actinophytocola gossypii]|uniref:Trans-aconitate 2-methyltransferase n=1 Tax=Actinophytocola gossypii TaxID=2812003 RepID=A0ABT2JAL6_9PSEU|nr:trans-aconitate 2-methyltransferase [Actinophytocola gossypii]MCT2584885.1 trans-aconitate 2-methyltransferase [Actinophytocola gossypii]